jgi:putative permease
VPATEQELERAIFRALWKALLVAAFLYLLFEFLGAITFLILYFGLVFLIAAVLNPIVAWLQRHHIPRPIGTVGLVLGIVGILVGVGYLVIPQFTAQAQQFAQNLPGLWNNLQHRLEGFLSHHPQLRGKVPTWEGLLGRIGPWISGFLGQIYQYTFAAMEGIVLLILLVMMVIYSLARPEPLVAGLLGAVPERGRSRAEEILSLILQRMKSWAIGTVELAVILAVLSGVGLHFLGVPYPFVFAIIAGIGELVPTIGPLVTAIPPLLTALAIHPMLAVWVGVLYLGLHQIENHLLVPLVMGRAVDMHPLSVTFAVLVMATLFGLLGIIIAVPAALIIKTLYQELYLARQVKSEAALLARTERVIAESAPPEDPDERAAERQKAA